MWELEAPGDLDYTGQAVFVFVVIYFSKEVFIYFSCFGERCSAVLLQKCFANYNKGQQLVTAFIFHGELIL